MRFEVGERFTIPSPIEIHAHLREPGGTHKETIASGTAAAAFGGYQAIFDMPNNPNLCETWTAERLEEKQSIAESTAYTATGYHAGVDLKDPALHEFERMVRLASGLKIYAGPTTGNQSFFTLEDAKDSLDAWMDEAHESGVKPPILLHAVGRTGFDMADYVAAQGYPVHWCHISTSQEAKLAAQLTAHYPDNYSGGVTPHHLTMTQRNADFQQGWHGARMQPPLGKERDAHALLQAFNVGDIQILETDHAPHTSEEKLAAEAANPEGSTSADCVTCYGVSGIEFVLPIMASLVQHRLTTMERVVDSLYYQPLKTLGLEPGEIENTTTLEFGPYVLGENHIASKSRNTPYIGWTAWARVIEMTRSGRMTELGDIRAGNKKILKYGGTL